MSKKSKTQKLDSTQFFQPNTTAVPDAPPPEDRFARPRFDARDQSRDFNKYDSRSGSRFSSNGPKLDGDIVWRRPNSVSNHDTIPPTTGDKWGNITFAKGSGVAALKNQSDIRTHSSVGASNEPAPRVFASEEKKLETGISKISLENSKSENSKAANKKKQDIKKKIEDTKKATAAKAAIAFQAAEAEEAQTFDLAKEVVGTGKKGKELTAYINGLETKPTGSALLKAVLGSLVDPLSLKWPMPSEYGDALRTLLSSKSLPQVLSLYAIMIHCSNISFPKITVKDNTRSLIEILFQICYQNDIIEHESFVSWIDDEKEVKGKQTALVQISSFLEFLTEVSEPDEEEEDDDIDSPLPTVP